MVMRVGVSERRIRTDVLVIGGGMAGMFAAIKAREQGMDVTLTDKGYVGKSGSTAYAEGDILFFRKSKDDLQEWLDIISKRVEYLNNRTWDEICLTEAEDRYNDLVSYGVEFWEKDGKQYKWDTSAVGAPPSVYQDITMRAGKYAPTLRKKVLETGVRVLDNVMMTELLRESGAVVGAVGFHIRGGGLVVIQAGATVISTGTMSFKHDTSPTYFWTGDGEAMAYRAGAVISGREFNNGYLYGRRELQHVQEMLTGEVSGEIVESSYQHPFALGGGYSGWYSRPTLNSEGGLVVTPAWEAHMGRAPLYLDSETIPPKKWEWLREYFKRIDIAWEQGDKIDFDVFRGGKFQWPSSRMHLGSTYAGCGIWAADRLCSSGVPGLYSAGNTCATMASGAVYSGMGFGSNHAMVTGARAGSAAARYAKASRRPELGEAELVRAKDFVRAPLERKGGFGPSWVTQVIQSITVPYFYLGVKHAERLQAALTIAEFINGHLVPMLRATDAHEWRLCHETRNMALGAEMKLRASLYRTESRGDHFREDFPRRGDPEWLAWIKIKDEQGEMKLYKEPVPQEWWPDLTKPYEERYPAVLPMEEIGSPAPGRPPATAPTKGGTRRSE
jgi:succinate dehydrogenase/fumarate reductase flavoprotein subunit